ncbi:GerW family sporulation protein [Alkalihalobacillus sp. AL-G]|uniref:GerW family sporulation protein n=1 Tax=Alkalihalobacillus sp. AL-G TaxID=2926399 RepID=UPI00272C78CD|nr:GerW family sporulation protein [Alkalihalobacillus sp. AL-G]WLD92375.1 GerW family sporulation protein [Alkalihalobacillus sp. AL-G]
MSEHPIQGLMQTAMENIKEMIDVNTIIGDPVETPDGSVILTVSKVGFGFAAGGSQFKGPSEQQSRGGSQDGDSLPFGGGSGGGVSITPIAFLIVNSSGVKTIHLDNSTHLYERLLDLAPQVVSKIQGMLNNSNQQSGQQTGQQGQQQSGNQQSGRNRRSGRHQYSGDQNQSERNPNQDFDF